MQVFVVEDHPIMRQALSDLIEKKLGLTVCGSAATGEEAIQQLEQAAADLVLVDVALPGMSGLDLVQLLQEKQPTLPCLILSGHAEMTHIRRALGVGARGYVLKGNPAEIVTAIQTISGGDTYLSAAIRAKLTGKSG